MRAILKPAPRKGLEFQDIEPPKPGPGEILIRVLRGGICGTDLHIYDWDKWARGRIAPPVVIGHEFMGVVEGWGAGGGRYSAGQRVSAEGHITCAACERCRTGEAHVCDSTRILGIDTDGGFADLVTVPASNVVALPDSVPDDYGALLDPFGNAIHAVVPAQVAGRSVAVVGCGPIGLFAVAVARLAGASRIIAIEPVAHRREMAAELGAHLALHPRADDVQAEVHRLTRGHGADVVCEMSGHPDGIRLSLDLCRSAGQLRLLGLPENPVEIDVARSVIFKGINVQGVVGRQMYDTWDAALRFLEGGKIDLGPVITDRFPLEDFEDGFGKARNGDAAKVLLALD